MPSSFALEWIGLVAGVLCTGSTLPQLVGSIRQPKVPETGSIARNVMLAAGNFLWVIYGVSNRLLSVPVFCGLATTLLLLLLAQQLRVRRLRQTVIPPTSKENSP